MISSRCRGIRSSTRSKTAAARRDSAAHGCSNSFPRRSAGPNSATRCSARKSRSTTDRNGKIDRALALGSACYMLGDEKAGDEQLAILEKLNEEKPQPKTIPAKPEAKKDEPKKPPPTPKTVRRKEREARRSATSAGRRQDQECDRGTESPQAGGQARFQRSARRAWRRRSCHRRESALAGGVGRCQGRRSARSQDGLQPSGRSAAVGAAR